MSAAEYLSTLRAVFATATLSLLAISSATVSALWSGDLSTPARQVLLAAGITVSVLGWVALGWFAHYLIRESKEAL